MTKNETKELILRALSSYLGDDLYRAKNAFRNCSPKEMNEQYGHSGRTRQEILNEYQKHHDNVQEAIALVKSI